VTDGNQFIAYSMMFEYIYYNANIRNSRKQLMSGCYRIIILADPSLYESLLGPRIGPKPTYKKFEKSDLTEPNPWRVSTHVHLCPVEYVHVDTCDSYPKSRQKWRKFGESGTMRRS